jgi:hypothetical protein
MWNLIISSIVFVIVAWYIRRYLDEQGMPKGMTRGILVFCVAYAVSWSSGEAVDWVQLKIEGPQAVAASQKADGLTQLLKAAGQMQN